MDLAIQITLGIPLAAGVLYLVARFWLAILLAAIALFGLAAAAALAYFGFARYPEATRYLLLAFGAVLVWPPLTRLWGGLHRRKE
jgi:hypothetical protein